MYDENQQYNFDQNYTEVNFGKFLGFDGLTFKQEITIQPVENRLLIEIIPVTDIPNVIPNRGLFDQNYQESDLLVDENNVISPLLIDSRNGGVYADVLIEP